MMLIREKRITPRRERRIPAGPELAVEFSRIPPSRPIPTMLQDSEKEIS